VAWSIRRRDAGCHTTFALLLSKDRCTLCGAFSRCNTACRALMILEGSHQRGHAVACTGDAAEATCCVGDRGHRPARDHPAAAPTLHAARESPDSSHHVLDRVRRRELALKLRGEAEPFHRERLVEALFEGSRGAGVRVAEPAHEVGE